MECHYKEQVVDSMSTPDLASANSTSKAAAFERVLVAKTNATDTTTSGNSNSAGDMGFQVNNVGRFSAGDYVSGNNIRKNTRVTGVGTVEGVGSASSIHIDRPLLGNIGAAATVSIFQAREAAADGPPGFEFKAGTNITIGASSQNAVGATVLEITASGGALDIDGLSAIGALANADTFPVDDGDSGTNTKATMTQLKTYMQSGLTFPVTAVSNGATDQIATFSSATALDSDPDLTFDGTIFTVGSGTDADHQLRLLTMLNGDAALKVSHVSDATDAIAYTTESIEATLTSNSNGNNGAHQQFIGLKSDVDITANHASGTKTATGLLVDVDGVTAGTTTGYGLDVDVDGFDTNYAAVFRSGSVGIGALPDTNALLEITVPTATDNEALFLTSTHAPGASSNITGPRLRFNAKRDGSEAGKVTDDLGLLEWYGQDGAGNNQAFGMIKTRVTAITSDNETSSMQFAVATSASGALENVLSINGGAAAASSTVVIAGNLQVDGLTTTVNSTTIELDDKNITLANGLGNDAAVNGGGITLVSTQGDKTFNWVDSSDAWTSSENLELASGKSLIIGSASMSETDLEKLDGITDGTAAANKALVVDGSKDIGTLGTLTAANLTANTLVTTPALSVDSVAVLDTSSSSSQGFDCVSGGGAAKNLATYAFATYRTAKFIGQIVNNSTHETDCFEVLVTYDGDAAPGATSDVHMTTYAYISSNDTPMGTLAAVKSGTNIALQFTNTVADFTGSFAVTATQLIKQ
jgi:hypothetical protein